MNQPAINVTPLIDILLVLLIIFMVITPIRPSAFKARVPAEPINTTPVTPHPDTLVVTLNADGTLRLNTESDLGTTSEPGKLSDRLRNIFAERVSNGSISDAFADDPERDSADRAERSVFIKAPKGTPYGDVARVVDAVKSAGAFPIGLQIDHLD